MRWIESAGGPLVLVQAPLVSEWRGVLDGGDDYALACSVDGYLGVVRWRGSDVLVFNDEPFPTALLVRGQGCIFLRWVFAPDEAAVLAELPNLEQSKTRVGELTFECGAPQSALFDAGALGNDAENMEVSLPAGRVRVTTYMWKPIATIEFVVHVLEPEKA